MRAVRCDACGSKAMIAAAKCPACGHLFELRDGFGELLPLAYCSSCESYYPESVGSCRWCGTEPARPPIAPRVWYAAGGSVAALIAVIAVLQNEAAHSASRPQTKKTPPSASAVVSAPSATTPLDADTMTARVVTATTDSLASRTIADVDTVGGDSVRPPAIVSDPSPKAATAPIPTTRIATTLNSAEPRAASATKPISAPSVSPSAPKPAKSAASAPPRRSGRWVRSVSRHWVVVRSGASRESRIVASIGPNSRVELGESRGDWRRIRAKGIVGWVEPRSSFELVASR